MNPFNILDKFALIHDYWTPHIVGELNGQHVKLVKFLGEFVWHHHEHEDEMFFILEGELIMEFQDKTVRLQKNEMVIVPRGVEHRPVAEKEVWVMLFEPATTVNTGNTINTFTKNHLRTL